jgi:hypothetical protein
MQADVIQHFLESVGQKADIDLYLKIWRAQEKQSFAIIAADAPMVRTALDPFHFDLRILAGIGLYPVVLLGLFDAKDADRQAQRVYDWLVEDAVPAKILEPGPTMGIEDVEDIRQTIHTNTIPIVSLETAKETTTDGRFNLLSTLAARLATRKVIFLSPTAGLEREGTPHISMVNVALDYDRLRNARGRLAPRHHTLLRQARDLLGEVPQRMSVAVVSPLALLRELFTVAGAGTLIRRGSRIDGHANFDRVDRVRLRNLIESAFGKLLKAEALERGVERVYIEENYLGAALLCPTPVGVYLSKFAVDRAAQGEGIGGDLWSVLIRDYPSFFWRSRPDNAITPWYAKQCDGLVRFSDWHVFWRGLPPSRIEAAINYARTLPGDFQPPPLIAE